MMNGSESSRRRRRRTKPGARGIDGDMEQGGMHFFFFLYFFILDVFRRVEILEKFFDSSLILLSSFGTSPGPQGFSGPKLRG
jgi:hypothetical protein